MNIVLIHGINNEGSSAEKIVENWTSALFANLPKEMVDVFGNADYHAVYYGDLLATETSNWVSGTDDFVIMSSTETRESQDVVMFYREYQHRHEIDNAVVDSLDGQTSIAQGDGFGTRSAKSLARAIENSAPEFGQYLAKIYLPQAAAYLYKPALSSQIDLVVEGQLNDLVEPDEPVIVIGHSLGTVIGYRLLRKNTTRLTSKLFLTLGSPLGSIAIQKHIGFPRPIPSNVHRWLNVSDPLDFVVLQPRLDKLTFGNDRIENILVDNGSSDRHGVSEYLTQNTVRQSIYASIF